VGLCFSSTAKERRNYFEKEFEEKIRSIREDYFHLHELATMQGRETLEELVYVKATSLRFTDFNFDAGKQEINHPATKNFGLDVDTNWQSLVDGEDVPLVYVDDVIHFATASIPELREAYKDVLERIFREFDDLITKIHEGLRVHFDVRSIMHLVRNKKIFARLINAEGVSDRSKIIDAIEMLDGPLDEKVPSFHTNHQISVHDAIKCLIRALGDEQLIQLIRFWTGSYTLTGLGLSVSYADADHLYEIPIDSKQHAALIKRYAAEEAKVLGINHFDENAVLKKAYLGRNQPVTAGTCGKELNVAVLQTVGSPAILPSVLYSILHIATSDFQDLNGNE
jgi:hypothetical protein